MSISDLTGTTWVWNDEINFPLIANYSYSITFTSNNTSYSTLYYRNKSEQTNGLGYDSTSSLAYVYGSGWTNNAYKIVEITGGSSATDSDLISLFEANATQSQPASQLTVDLSTLFQYEWDHIPTGQHSLQIKAKASGFNDSPLSSPVNFNKTISGNKFVDGGVYIDPPAGVYTFDLDTFGGFEIKTASSLTFTLTYLDNYSACEFFIEEYKNDHFNKTLWNDDGTSPLPYTHTFNSSNYYSFHADMEQYSGVIKIGDPTLPVKGDIIKANLDGTEKNYRVIKMSGNIAQVLCMFDVGTSRFTNSGWQSTTDYSSPGNAVNIMCNETWYNTLSALAKNAIVDTQLTQDTWSWGDVSGKLAMYRGTYTGIDDVTHQPFTVKYELSKVTPQHTINITRHCYTLSVQEVLDYLYCSQVMTFDNTTLTKENIWEMFYGQTTSPGAHYIWLRDSCSHYDAYAMFLNGLDGNISESCYDYWFQNRPAFKLDLSKIPYEIIDED